MNGRPLFSRRDFAGRRLVVSLLRAMHLSGVVGIGAFLLGAGGVVGVSAFAFLLVAGGLGIMALDRWSDPAYLRQVNGLAMLVKLLLVAAIVWYLGLGLALFWSVLVLSVLVAHAPARIRHRKLF
jgi:hypothetical protein